MLSGQRHAPHRPLQQLVRTDNVGAGELGCGWAGELLGKVKGGERRCRGVERWGGGGEVAWRCPEGAANREESCDR